MAPIDKIEVPWHDSVWVSLHYDANRQSAKGAFLKRDT